MLVCWTHRFIKSLLRMQSRRHALSMLQRAFAHPAPRSWHAGWLRPASLLYCAPPICAQSQLLLLKQGRCVTWVSLGFTLGAGHACILNLACDLSLVSGAAAATFCCYWVSCSASMWHSGFSRGQWKSARQVLVKSTGWSRASSAYWTIPTYRMPRVTITRGL